VRQLSILPEEDSAVSGKPFFVGTRGIKRIGSALGADIVTVGLLKMQVDTVSVELLAYDVSAERLLFNSVVEGKRTAFYKLEKQLVEQFLEKMAIELQDEERARIYSHRPKDFSALLTYGLGLLNEKKGKDADALMAYQKALMDDEKMVLPYAAQARSFMRLSAPEKAMESYEKAVTKDPFFAEAWYRLNLYAAQRKDDEKALDCCLKALEVAPRFGKAKLSFGTRLHDLGRLQEAIEETKSAATILKVDPLPSYNLGLYYLEAGDAQAARGWFEQALRRAPDFELARAELVKLNQR